MSQGPRADRSGLSSPAEPASRIGASKPVKLALSLLTLLFALGTLLQLVQYGLGFSGLPPVEDLDGGLFPYGWLLVAQAGILAAMIVAIGAVDGTARPRLGLLLSLAGSFYLAAMLVRAGISAFGIVEDPWFQAPLPTSFHLVLASFAILLGLHWLRAGRRDAGREHLAAVARYLLYPVTLAAALGLFAWSIASGIAAPFAAYHAAVLGGAVIVIAELLLPYRPHWQATREELKSDVAYIALVQIALPAALSAGLVALAAYLPSIGLEIWPHGWSIAAQLVVMVLLADFARYWLHRACHSIPALWRLHAVHHSPEGLHALNVGRFHPIEKALQVVIDGLPFLLIGVAPDVLAAYLVLFSVNGFFHHANIDLRLGWLNWVFSGPELHRWHHSRDPRISDHNFGSILIFWDTLFGTRLLPAGEEVEDLGLRNRAYPQDPLQQTLAPFLVDPNRGGAE